MKKIIIFVFLVIACTLLFAGSSGVPIQNANGNQSYETMNIALESSRGSTNNDAEETGEETDKFLRTIVETVWVIIGIIFLFLGYKFFKSASWLFSAALLGFFTGMLGYTITSNMLIAAITSIIGIVIGILIHKFIYFVMIFLLGSMATYMLVNMISENTNNMLFVAIIGGLIALLVRRFAIIVTTSVLGFSLISFNLLSLIERAGRTLEPGEPGTGMIPVWGNKLHAYYQRNIAQIEELVDSMKERFNAEGFFDKLSEVAPVKDVAMSGTLYFYMSLVGFFFILLGIVVQYRNDAKKKNIVVQVDDDDN